jgi:hypothetical protein
VLLYGSCLRSGNFYDGLLDLYLVCDSYRSAYRRRALAAGNWLLAPNVFYAEHSAEGRTLRSKVSVISLEDFRRGCSPSTFESYIWGRFSQPTCILFARDQRSREQVEQSLLEAGRTLLLRALPVLPQQGSISDLWTKALAQSYAAELRTERSGRATELVQSSLEFYTAITRHHADSLGLELYLRDEAREGRYHSLVSTPSRRLGAWCWFLRRAQGKMLSVTRLLKAFFTFEGGLDYIAWKLERHSGQEIVIPDKVRRAPLIYLWGFFWQLYRRGIFR